MRLAIGGHCEWDNERYLVMSAPNTGFRESKIGNSVVPLERQRLQRQKYRTCIQQLYMYVASQKSATAKTGNIAVIYPDPSGMYIPYDVCS